MLSHLVEILLAASDRLDEDCRILVTESARLSMVGRRVPLAPIRRSHMSIAVSDIVVLLDKSVSSVETERMASSRVFGIFWASAMWSNVVAKLLIVTGWCSGMRFLASRNLCASSGLWDVEIVSRSAG